MVILATLKGLALFLLVIALLVFIVIGIEMAVIMFKLCKQEDITDGEEG